MTRAQRSTQADEQDRPAMSPEALARQSKAGKARMRALSATQRRAFATQGAAARWSATPKADRSEIMRAVVRVRWAKRAKQKQPTTPRKRSRQSKPAGSATK